jgi:hypothetical protein
MLSSGLGFSFGQKFDIQFNLQAISFNKNSMRQIYPKSVSPERNITWEFTCSRSHTVQ